jgi:hypothetical protein
MKNCDTIFCDELWGDLGKWIREYLDNEEKERYRLYEKLKTSPVGAELFND